MRTPHPTASDVLIIDDDASLAEMLALQMDDLGFTATAVHRGDAARHFMADHHCRLVLLDQHLPDTNGLKLLGWIRTHHPELPVIMMTGFHEMDLVITAMKNGAYDYLHKPIDTAKLEALLKKILAHKTETRAAVKTEPDHASDKPEIIGSSSAMLDVCKKIAIAAQNEAPVLITGPSGTGKELAARAIHAHSGRTGPFIAINCSAIVETLLESELFGHEKGSFTGADRQKPGKFESAENGTLFLDEIGEMSPHLQAKILRVLQEHTFERVGGVETLHSNARVITATHRNLRQMITEHHFREDLYYRLQVLEINMPALHERMEDLPALISHLLMRINKELHKNLAGISTAAMDKLKAHPWPGNVRELENVLMRAAATTHGQVIDAMDIELPSGTAKNVPGAPPPALVSLDEIEKQHILYVLGATDHHLGRTCEILGISRPALDRRLKRWGVK